MTMVTMERGFRIRLSVFFALALALTIGCATEPARRAAAPSSASKPALPKKEALADGNQLLPVIDRARSWHLLSRFSFGSSEEQAREVERLGIENWFKRQLKPESIEDKTADRALALYHAVLKPPMELPRQYLKAEMMAEYDDGEKLLDGRQINEVTDFDRLLGDAQMSQLVRHVSSERQVQEVMVDFWTNHFNVFARKGLVKLVAADYVERAIRPHALGRFEELLVATARHPAMLVYLDNNRSVVPRPKRKRGITENYARELLELHTLGVDGGYTESDVIAVARVLTGWGVKSPKEGYGFEFNERAHDRGSKVVLGEDYPEGKGEEEGLRLLKQLAQHPSTARHLARKLCIRFVSDEVPEGCVKVTEAAFQRSHGDIKATLWAILESKEFWAAESRRSKLKSPLEFLASALRAVDAKWVESNDERFTQIVDQLGQPILMQAVPTGYPDEAEEWASAGGALARMNVATALALGELPGVEVDLDQLLPDPSDAKQFVQRVNERFFGGSGSVAALSAIKASLAETESPKERRVLAVALALGSPDFQRQ